MISRNFVYNHKFKHQIFRNLCQNRESKMQQIKAHKLNFMGLVIVSEELMCFIMNKGVCYSLEWLIYYLRLHKFQLDSFYQSPSSTGDVGGRGSDVDHGRAGVHGEKPV